MKRLSMVWIPMCLGVFVLGMAAGSMAQVSDTASAVPWSLDLEVDKFGSINVTTKAGKSETIWYLAYTLKNNSGKDAPLSGVHFRLDTDTKKVYRETAHKKAEEALEARHDTKLTTARERSGALADGDSLRGLAIFGKLDPELDKIVITATGLEDVVYRVGPKRFFKKRGLQLEWARPGDEYFTERDPLKFVKRSWKVLAGPREIR